MKHLTSIFEHYESGSDLFRRMSSSTKYRRINSAMESGEYARCDYLPEPLPDERVFRLVECVQNTTVKESDVEPRRFSPLTGKELNPRPLKFQMQAAQLPAARGAKRIQAAIEESSVVIVKGDTGSGKSTQIPQIVLDLMREGVLDKGLVVHVWPLGEPLFGLHTRLEAEMDA